MIGFLKAFLDVCLAFSALILVPSGFFYFMILIGESLGAGYPALIMILILSFVIYIEEAKK